MAVETVFSDGWGGEAEGTLTVVGDRVVQIKTNGLCGFMPITADHLDDVIDELVAVRARRWGPREVADPASKSATAKVEIGFQDGVLERIEGLVAAIEELDGVDASTTFPAPPIDDNWRAKNGLYLVTADWGGQEVQNTRRDFHVSGNPGRPGPLVVSINGVRAGNPGYAAFGTKESARDFIGALIAAYGQAWPDASN